MEGRGSAILAVVAMVIVSAMAPGAFAANHVVGGTQLWNFPPTNDATYYDGTWAPSQTFRVGDTLQFQYSSAIHDVVQYGTKAEYDACSGAQVAKWTSGNDIIPLNATGVNYYICSFPGHCTGGMKVSVSVTTAAVPPASPPTTTTPSPPATGTPPGTTSPSSPPKSGATSGPVLSMLGLVVSAVLAASAAFLAV